MMKLNYEYIIDSICEANDIGREELMEICKDKDLKYISLLLLNKYDCTDLDKIRRDFRIKTKRNLKYNQSKAHEKLLVNYKFREKYFNTDKSLAEKNYLKEVK